MKIKRVARNSQWDITTQQIVQLCFDNGSIDKYEAGLKLVYAVDDPPLFVRVEEIDTNSNSHQAFNYQN